MKLAILSMAATIVLTAAGCQTAKKTEKPDDSGVTKTATKPENKLEGTVVLTANFEGKSDHKTSGEVTLQKNENSYQVVLAESFDFDGAPAPILALGKDGYKKESRLGELISNKGLQVYEIPASINAEKHNEVWLWCTKYDVPLGVAKFPER